MNAVVRKQRKLRERRKHIFLAYAARTVAVLTIAMLLVLLVCGFLFIIEHIQGKDVVYGKTPNLIIESADKVEMLTSVTISEKTTAVNSGKVVVLDAGHGGKDEGTSWSNIKEKDIVLDIAMELKEELERRGVTVIMTRTDDTYLSLEERTKIGNAENADLFLSIHVDWYEGDSSIHGLTCHYMEGSRDGLAYASALTEEIEAAKVVSVRNETASDFYVLKNTQMPAILIETGYLSNMLDRKNLADAEFQKNLAECIAEGVSEILKDEND